MVAATTEQPLKKAVLLHYLAYPHIMEAIIVAASWPALLVLRKTCKFLKDLVDQHRLRHIRISLGMRSTYTVLRSTSNLDPNYDRELPLHLYQQHRVPLDTDPLFISGIGGVELQLDRISAHLNHSKRSKFIDFVLQLTSCDLLFHFLKSIDNAVVRVGYHSTYGPQQPPTILPMPIKGNPCPVVPGRTATLILKPYRRKDVVHPWGIFCFPTVPPGATRVVLNCFGIHGKSRLKMLGWHHNPSLKEVVIICNPSYEVDESRHARNSYDQEMNPNLNDSTLTTIYYTVVEHLGKAKITLVNFFRSTSDRAPPLETQFLLSALEKYVVEGVPFSRLPKKTMVQLLRKITAPGNITHLHTEEYIQLVGQQQFDFETCDSFTGSGRRSGYGAPSRFAHCTPEEPGSHGITDSKWSYHLLLDAFDLMDPALANHWGLKDIGTMFPRVSDIRGATGLV